jgi:hypothetical protein
MNLTTILNVFLSKPETIIAAASLLVALCALGVSIFNSYLVRKHNRLSVEPYLGFSVSYGTETTPIGLYLANNGVGPAILKELKISLDGQPFRTSTGHPWNMVWMDAGYNKPTVAYSFPEAGIAIRVGEIFSLVTVDTRYETQTERAEFHAALKRVDIEVRYESVYGKNEKIARLQEMIAAHRPTIG